MSTTEKTNINIDQLLLELAENEFHFEDPINEKELELAENIIERTANRLQLIHKKMPYNCGSSIVSCNCFTGKEWRILRKAIISIFGGYRVSERYFHDDT